MADENNSENSTPDTSEETSLNDMNLDSENENEVTDSEPPTAPSQNLIERFGKKKLLIALGVVVLVALLAAGYVFGKSYLYAGSVNGEKISRWEVIRSLEEQGGQQVLDDKITDALIEQQAQEMGVTVTNEEIDAEMASLQGDIEAQGQNFDQFLSSQGLSAEDARERFRYRLLIEKILADEVTVTDEDVDEFIEQNREQLGDAVDPDSEEFRAQARDQVRQQKLQGEIQTWLEELRKEADIKYYRYQS